MATLVTGGTGFVGPNIVRVLAEKGHDVVSLDISPPDDLVRRYLAPWKDKVTWEQADILDMTALERVASDHRLDKVVHAAVYTAVREDIEKADSRRIIDINLNGTVNLLEMARQAGVKRFVYVSSGGVYGEGRSPGEPLKEDMPLDPRSLYGATKYASELIIRRYGDLHGMETASGRLSGPYGPMERTTGHRAVMSMMYDWTGKAVRGEPIQVQPRPSSGDLTYALDIAGGLAALLDAPALNHSVYNVSRGIMVTLGELVEAFREAVPGIQFIEPVSKEAETGGVGTGRGPMDTTRLREDTGFKPQYDIVAGVKDYIQWRRDFGFLQ